MSTIELRLELPGLGEAHPKGTAFFLIVDPELHNTDSRCAGAELPAGAAYRVVHVMGRWAGGEVRGYLLHGGELTPRGPNYIIRHWPELDELVTAALRSAGLLASAVDMGG